MHCRRCHEVHGEAISVTINAPIARNKAHLSQSWRGNINLTTERRGIYKHGLESIGANVFKERHSWKVTL